MKKILLLALMVSGISNLQAQTINTQLLEVNFAGDGFPKDVTPANGKVYFSAITESAADRSLWVYDETLMQTIQLDTNVDTGNATIDDGNFTMVGNILYFTQALSSDENILLRSNGTPEGTYVVKTLTENAGGNAEIANLTAYNGKLYFTARDNAHGNELWVSDGTEAGTHILNDINPGVNGSTISSMFVFNNLLFFAAYTPSNGTELWKSDGTEAGTNLFKDITGDTYTSTTGEHIIFNNHFYFYADDGIHGRELWSSDGTAAGTMLFKEFADGAFGVNGLPEGIVVTNDYFVLNVIITSSQSQLWRCGGTPETTTLLKTISTGQDGFNAFKQFTVFDDEAYFVGESFIESKKLWKTDGTPTGTVQVINMADISAGNIYNLSAAQDYLIFSASQGGYNKPWISNGTQAGTQILIDYSLNITTGGDNGFYPAGNLVYFPAIPSIKNGAELMVTNGTATGTHLIRDIHHRYAGLLGQGALSGTVLNTTIVFAGNNGEHGIEPFTSNGTIEGTTMLKDINTGENNSIGFTNESNSNIFTKAGNKLFFNANTNSTGSEIYVTDGTEAGTMLVKDIAPGSANGISAYTYFVEFNSIFYFKANDSTHGNELWRTDGTEAGTYMVKDIFPGASSGVVASNSYTYSHKNYAVYNGNLYFPGNDADGPGIWKTDGTEAGTAKVITLNAGGSNLNIIIVGATTNNLFLASNGVSTLWSSNGTQSGTTLLGTYPDNNLSNFLRTAVLNNELYFTAETIETGRCLFKSDGTAEGTVLVKGTINDSPESNYVAFMQLCGNKVYFGMGNISSSDYSNDLWSTDGTTEGTIKLSTWTEPDYTAMSSFTCLTNHLMYTRPTSNNYLWITDGSIQNTVPITVNTTNAPQFEANYGLVSIIGVTGNTIYFEGNTKDGGTELYAANVEGILEAPYFEDNNNNASVTILMYPNPANEIVTLSSVNNIAISNVEVYDFTGKKVYDTQEAGLNISFPVKHLSAGIYLVKIKTGNIVVTKKLIRN